MTKTTQTAAILLTEQPNPTGSGASITDSLLVLERVQGSELLRELFRLRRGQGRARYGVELRAGNGRDPRRDLVQELTDAALYAEQDRMEGTGSADTVDEILDLLQRLTGDPDHEPRVPRREVALRGELERAREAARDAENDLHAASLELLSAGVLRIGGGVALGIRALAGAIRMARETIRELEIELIEARSPWRPR